MNQINATGTTSESLSSDKGLSEDKLVKAAAAGDADAFALLYDAYVERIYRFTCLRVDDRQTAEDLTSQVFMKAWQNLGRYRQRRLSFGAWLFRVARNAIIDHYRTYKRVEPLERLAATKADPAADVSVQVEQQLTAEWLWAKLHQITDDQREVLVLKFVEGLSTKEVASIVGKRPGAVRALQMRALQTLAQIMGKNEA